MGEVYFRVSKHTGLGMIEIIRRKFEPEIKMLIIKYSTIIHQEQDEAERIEKEIEKSKNNIK